MKGILVKGMKMPRCCAECIFISDFHDIHIGNGLYRKFSHCKVSNIENPWRDVQEQIENRAEYCPLVEVK